MDKPISVMIQEMKNDVLYAVTKHNLHPSITRMVIGDIYREICTVADHQYLQERETYENANKTEETAEQN